MKRNLTLTMAAALAVLPFTVAGQSAYELAQETRQSLAVSKDLVKRVPGWPTDGIKAILMTYSIDGLSGRAVAPRRVVSGCW